MSTVTVTVDADLRARLEVCIAERDEGMKLAEEADRSGWNKALLDQAIDYLAATGRPFSANDLRVLLPDDLPGPLFGSRFQHASRNRRVIRFAGYTTSTKKNTHAKPVALWVGRNN
jgi:hypothetical protein